MTRDPLIQPPTPIQPPSAPPPSTMPWWVTTILGILVPVLTAGAMYVEEPWRGLLLTIAGSIAAALGLSHTGAVQLRPPPAAAT